MGIMDTQTLIGLAILLVLLVSVAYAAYKLGAKGASNQLATVRADVSNLDRIENSVVAKFTPEQLNIFREIAFPMFALGLALTPQGDLKNVIAQAKDLTDVLTDRKPNVPPAQQTIAGAAGTEG